MELRKGHREPRRKFEAESTGSVSGRYRVELVSGETRQKSRPQGVQRVLDEGNVPTTSAGGAWVTGVY